MDGVVFSGLEKEFIGNLVIDVVGRVLRIYRVFVTWFVIYGIYMVFVVFCSVRGLCVFLESG